MNATKMYINWFKQLFYFITNNYTQTLLSFIKLLCNIYFNESLISVFMIYKEGNNYNCDYNGSRCWLYWLSIAQYWV